MDNDDYLEFAKQVIDLYEKDEILEMGEYINNFRLIAKKDPSAQSPAAMAGSDAHFKPASDYTDEGLVQLALEVYARAASYMTKELHDRAMEAKQELLKRLKKRH